MEQKLHSFLNFLKVNNNASGGLVQKKEPEIGFKLFYYESLNQLKVKVIGLRNPPTNYGSASATGFVVKVTVFPDKNKFETKIVKDNWSTINEEFTFNLTSSNKNLQNNLKGKFVSLTVYAVLEETEEEKPQKPKTTTVKRFLSLDESSNFFRNKAHRNFGRRSFRNSMKDRRTIGAVTYNLEKTNFSQSLKGNLISTPDVWRSIKEITSGIQTHPREGKKGCLELTLQYAISEDGTNDMVEVSVTKFRCNLQTMQEHEKVGGQLYIKITAFESDDIIQKKKSDRFDPTISLKLEANTATLRARVNSYALNQIKIVIRLISKNIVGKKVILGIIEIDKNNQFWKEIVNSPGVPITKMINFE